jgi:hypothetical protein
LPDGIAISATLGGPKCVFCVLWNTHRVIGGETPPLSFPASVAALLVSAALGGRSECRRVAFVPLFHASPRSQKNVLAI